MNETGLAVFLDFKTAIERLGKDIIKKQRYGNLFDMYEEITDVSPYEQPMQIFPPPCTTPWAVSGSTTTSGVRSPALRHQEANYRITVPTVWVLKALRWAGRRLLRPAPTPSATTLTRSRL